MNDIKIFKFSQFYHFHFLLLQPRMLTVEDKTREDNICTFCIYNFIFNSIQIFIEIKLITVYAKKTWPFKHIYSTEQNPWSLFKKNSFDKVSLIYIYILDIGYIYIYIIIGVILCFMIRENRLIFLNSVLFEHASRYYAGHPHRQIHFNKMLLLNKYFK